MENKIWVKLIKWLASCKGISLGIKKRFIYNEEVPQTQRFNIPCKKDAPFLSSDIPNYTEEVAIIVEYCRKTI